MVDAIANLQVNIDTNTAEATTALNEVEKAGKTAGSSFEETALSSTRLERALVSMAARTTGLNVEMAHLGGTLAALGGAGGVMIVLAGAIALVGEAYDKLTESSKKAAEQLEKVNAELAKKMGFDIATLAEQRNEQQDKLDSLNKQIARQFGDTPRDQLPSGIREQLDEYETHINTLNMRIADMESATDKSKEAQNEMITAVGAVIENFKEAHKVIPASNDDLIELANLQAAIKVHLADTNLTLEQHNKLLREYNEIYDLLSKRNVGKGLPTEELGNKLPSASTLPEESTGVGIMGAEGGVGGAGDKITGLHKKVKEVQDAGDKEMRRFNEHIEQEWGKNMQNAITNAFQMAFDGKKIGSILLTFGATILKDYANIETQIASHAAASKATAAENISETAGATATEGATAEGATPLLSNPFTVGIGLSIIALAMEAASKAMGGGGAAGGTPHTSPHVSNVINTTYGGIQNMEGITTPTPVNLQVVGLNSPSIHQPLILSINQAQKRGYTIS